MKPIVVNFLLHTSAGYFIASFLDFFLPLYIACIIAVICGIAREIYGWKVSKTGFSIGDLAETMYGVAIWFFLIKIHEEFGLIL